MTEKCFVDTNVFLYANDLEDLKKQKVARVLLESLASDRRATVSTQVINEFAANAIYKLRFPNDRAIAAAKIFERFEFVALGPTHTYSALELRERYQLNFWDALIVAAALAGGCKTLYTEDLNHGQKIAGLKVVDPFA